MDDRFKNLPDWQQRFLVEYKELADRAEKLCAMLDKYDAGLLDFQPQTPIGLLRAQLSVPRSHRGTSPRLGLLRAQLSVMSAYMAILEVRAEFEDIDLSILADPEE